MGIEKTGQLFWTFEEIDLEGAYEEVQEREDHFHAIFTYLAKEKTVYEYEHPKTYWDDLEYQWIKKRYNEVSDEYFKFSSVRRAIRRLIRAGRK